MLFVVIWYSKLKMFYENLQYPFHDAQCQIQKKNIELLNVLIATISLLNCGSV